MISPINAVTFDAAGTLFKVAEPVGATYSRIARIHEIEAGPDALDRAFRALWNRFPPPFEDHVAELGGFDGPAIERQWWHTFVRNVFTEACESDAHFSPQKFEALFNDLFDYYAAASAWHLLPDVREVLEAIQGRVKIGIISNFDLRFHTIIREFRLEHYFDSVILSCEIGSSKPHPAIFAASANDLGFDPQEILHVGDDPVRDGQGAKEAGYQSYLVDPETSPLRMVPVWIESRI